MMSSPAPPPRILRLRAPVLSPLQKTKKKSYYNHTHTVSIMLHLKLSFIKLIQKTVVTGLFHKAHGQFWLAVIIIDGNHCIFGYRIWVIGPQINVMMVVYKVIRLTLM